MHFFLLVEFLWLEMLATVEMLAALRESQNSSLRSCNILVHPFVQRTVLVAYEDFIQETPSL